MAKCDIAFKYFSQFHNSTNNKTIKIFILKMLVYYVSLFLQSNSKIYYIFYFKYSLL